MGGGVHMNIPSCKHKVLIEALHATNAVFIIAFSDCNYSRRQGFPIPTIPRKRRSILHTFPIILFNPEITYIIICT